MTTASLAADFCAFKKFIHSALYALQGQIEVLGRIIDRQEMKMRRKMILLHGVPEDKSEDVPARVTGIFAENLDLPNFSSVSIKSSYRLGRSLGGKPRPIVVKFREVAIRDKVWYAKTKLKGTSYTQSEFLTKPRHSAFLAARERFGLNKCWTRDGNIFIITPDGTRHRVECLSDLGSISDVSPGEPTHNITATSKSLESKATASRPKRLLKNK